MPHAAIREQMPVDSMAVFDVVHDYGKRLEWDTLLKEARLTRGHTKPEKGATSICVGKPLFGVFGMETEYLEFRRGEIAAVSLINRPPLFESFVASIRHEDNDRGSLATYTFRFTSRPRVFRRMFDPILLFALKRETARRLASLARYLSDSDAPEEREKGNPAKENGRERTEGKV